MSHRLILASVTAILKNIIENGLVDRAITTSIGSESLVAALPPDRIATGADEKAQLNLFLYHVVPKGLNSQSRHANTVDGEPSNRTPQALDLYYLLTAYGAQDFQIELLLGHALEVLNEHVLLTPEMIEATLAALSSPVGGRIVQPAMATLAAPGLAAQFAQIKICPQSMNIEEMSRLWAMLQARYRPSAAYKVSVVING